MGSYQYQNAMKNEGHSAVAVQRSRRQQHSTAGNLARRYPREGVAVASQREGCAETGPFGGVLTGCVLNLGEGGRGDMDVPGPSGQRHRGGWYWRKFTGAWGRAETGSTPTKPGNKRFYSN